MALEDVDAKLLARLEGERSRNAKELARLDGYYDGLQRLDHLGFAAPDEVLKRFETVVNVPRMAVDEPVRRQVLRAFQRSGSSEADPALREAWEANNLDSQAPLVHKDARIFGRSFVSVGSNAEDPEHPLVCVEDPREISVWIDVRSRRMRAALKVTQDPLTKDRVATFWTPDVRWTFANEGGSGWGAVDCDEHGLGRVPLVMFLNRPRAGKWRGTSEMADVLKLTDGIAQLITNMLIASETHAVPDKWAAGVAASDFVDRDGNPLPTWETYFSAIKATSNKDAKFGQFSASDLKNFHDSVNNMLAWCAAVLGLPTRYAGQQSVNPAAEGAIRADESRLIRNVELMNASDGDSWAWVMGLYERFRTGEWLRNNDVRTLWADPATPTKSQMGDYVMKLHAEKVLSREGVWDELGWDDARKDRERSYFEREASDPVVAQIMREVSAGAEARSVVGAVRGGAAGDGVGAADVAEAPAGP